MFTKIIISLFLAFTLSGSYANCELPSRLLKDVLLDDILSFTAEKNSATKDFLEKEGFESYDEFSYMNESYSEAIVSLIKQREFFGASYYNLIKGESNIDLEVVEKAMLKILGACEKQEAHELLSIELMKALKGKNLLIESELMKISISLKYKYQ
jgi:hypothetical protein